MGIVMANNLRFAGKVAVIAAGTKGIGLASARELGRNGAKVVVSSRAELNVNSAVNQLKADHIDAFGVVCDSTKTADVKQLFKKVTERYGGIDILFSNIGGITHVGPLLECSDEAWQENFDTNVKSNFAICKEVVPYMENRGGGAIVLTSSVAALKIPPVVSAYGIAKLALCGLVKALIFELGPKNIRINAIAPSVVKTDFSEGMWRPESEIPADDVKTRYFISKVKEYIKDDSEDAVRNWILSRYTTSGRFADPEECAKVVCFLASKDASYINGESITIAGGIASSV